MKKRIAAFALSFGLAVTTLANPAAVKAAEEPTDTIQAAVTSVKFTEPSKSATKQVKEISMKVGTSRTLRGIVSPSSSNSAITVSFTTSDSSVASITTKTKNRILVKANKAGTATLTATAKPTGAPDGYKLSATCKVTVTGTSSSTATTATTKVEPTKVVVTPSKKTICIGDQVTLTAVVTPTDATNKTIIWSSSNKSIATVKNGVVTGKNAGTATITAKAAGNTKVKKTVTVKVKRKKVDLEKTSLTLGVKKTAYINVSETVPQNARVSFRSQNTSIATVTSRGKVTAKKKGTTTIEVYLTSDPNIYKACKVTVK